MASEKIIKSAKQTLNAFGKSILILLAVMLLIALVIEAVPADFLLKALTGNKILDSLVGAAFGSIAAGNPLNSYIIGGELLSQGIDLIVVTAFILAWVTVGIVQLPAESMLLGKKFAVTRNALSFVSAIIIAMLVSLILIFIQ
jgi:uncharacterized membrane protein YraQ (UPF0718 family)